MQKFPCFDYRGGELYCEELPVRQIAQEVGTPLFLYSASAMEQAYLGFADALRAEGLPADICYAVKANPHQAVIQTFAALGAGGDVVSEGELRRTLAAGIPAEKTVFAGVGKTRGEMAFALKQGIHQFNVESLEEMEQLNAVALDLALKAPIALRINPDVDAKTHAKITTGKSENKFGVNIDQAPEVLRRAQALPGLSVEGLAIHIGSQLTDITPYETAFLRLAELFQAMRAEGMALQRLDLGGGLGIAYQDETPPDPKAYAALVKRSVGHLGVPLVFEPGRYLVGNAGILVCSIIYVKRGSSRDFVIVDAAMNDLIRPTLYEAWHDIYPVSEKGQDGPHKAMDVVGPVCESGDYFAKQRPLPELASEELLAIFSSGAYGATMASTYNSRLPAAEVLVRQNDYAVVSERMSYDQLIGRDKLPSWLAKNGHNAEVA